MEGRTTLVVAHRLSTVQGADVVAVVDGGPLWRGGRTRGFLRRKGPTPPLVKRQLTSQGRPTRQSSMHWLLYFMSSICCFQASYRTAHLTYIAHWKFDIDKLYLLCTVHGTLFRKPLRSSIISLRLLRHYLATSRALEESAPLAPPPKPLVLTNTERSTSSNCPPNPLPRPLPPSNHGCHPRPLRVPGSQDPAGAPGPAPLPRAAAAPAAPRGALLCGFTPPNPSPLNPIFPPPLPPLRPGAAQKQGCVAR